MSTSSHAEILAPLAATMALAACQPTPLPQPLPASTAAATASLADEPHISDLRQLTFGGENAEAYWSFDGSELVFQARPTGRGCDQIYRMRVDQQPPKPVLVSTGHGVTTCAHFMPKPQDEIIYASTHLASKACPPRPDHSQGYVWPLHPGYDIFRTSRERTAPLRLTDSPGYDAEATVCGKDGSIVFTSLRDGDLELYRMNADGSGVKRLTDAPGYDGGAFFNQDCSKLVWRASRPQGEALADYRRLLVLGLVRPTKLEIYVAEADGSDARQITYLDAASFAPFFMPSSNRILFSSNFASAGGREFDLWAVDIDGSKLERITHRPGFDGFPMFSPDGTMLAFSSNRATAPGKHDTNVFLARWIDQPRTVSHETAADRMLADIAWLAAPERMGRAVGSAGLEASGAYLEKRFATLALQPAAGPKSYRQHFQVSTKLEVGPSTSLSIAGKALAPSDFRPLAFSAEGKAEGQVVLAGYGIVAEHKTDKTNKGVNDYAKVSVKNKIVLVRRFLPPAIFGEREGRLHSDLRRKAWLARQHGARGLLIVDQPAPSVASNRVGTRPKSGHGPAAVPEEAQFPPLVAEGYGDAGLPVVIVKRKAARPMLEALSRKREVLVALDVKLERQQTTAFNVVGRLPANVPASQRLEGVLVVGAHYDHLGTLGFGSLADNPHEVHLGADDNSSGVAAMLEVARQLGNPRVQRRRELWFVAFSAEERGLLGSTHLVRKPPAPLRAGNVVAMLNMDMVGRLQNNQLSVLGAKSAEQWPQLLEKLCRKARISCSAGSDGHGPSDQTPFYAAGAPVLQFFTGTHHDYHKPSDIVSRINAAGAGQIAGLVADTALEVLNRPTRLTYQQTQAPTPRGDRRSWGASLGSIPDYVGPPKGQKGVLFAGVRKGGAAQLAGMKRGDLLIKLGAHDIGDVRDLMYALMASKPGQPMGAVILRNGKRIELEVTLQPRKRKH